jgi:hypothetical protein
VDDNTPTDDQDVPTTREHRRGRSRACSRRRSHSGSSSRGLVTPQPHNVSNH